MVFAVAGGILLAVFVLNMLAIPGVVRFLLELIPIAIGLLAIAMAVGLVVAIRYS